MKIEYVHIDVTSARLKDIKLENRNFEALPQALGYVEEYAEKNGFTAINAEWSVGGGMYIYLVKR